MEVIVPAGERTVPAARAARRRADLSRAFTIGLCLLPAAAIYALLVIYPIIQAGYVSLFDWNGLGPLAENVGLANFRRVLNDQVFIAAIRHNLVILVLSIVVQLPLALGLALLVGRSMPGRAVFRTIFFLPYILSEVITGLVWTFLFRQNTGLVDQLLSIIPGYTPRGWLGNPDVVLYAVFAVITWKFFGFHLILYLAGLQAIPLDLEEAAMVDGATRLRSVWDITVPLLAPTIRLSIFLSAIGSLQFFDLVWVMTKGGPVNASSTMATYMYSFGFQRFALGYGAAVSLVIFVICFAFALVYQRAVLRREVALV